MKLFSEDTLAHYGIPGQKKGVRRWQYPDGRFNEEGKERYFGQKPSLGDKFVKGLKSGFGVRDNDQYAVPKAVGGIVASPFFKLYSSAVGAKKANDNAKKLGIKESELKSFVKNLVNVSNLATDNYNVRRSEGQGRLRAYLGANFVDSFKDLFTLGDSSYYRKEEYGLEHSYS